MSENQAFDETAILIRLRNGDHHAFEQLYHQYKRRIAGHLLHMFRDEALVQDILQDTFIKIWEHRAQLNEHASFKAFLFTVATNNAYNAFQKASREDKVRSGFHMALKNVANQVEDYIFRKEHAELLRSLLALLPEKQREVFRLAKIEGYSYAEISKQLNISPNTINTHLKRANGFLRKQLSDHPELLLFLFVIQFI